LARDARTSPPPDAGTLLWVRRATGGGSRFAPRAGSFAGASSGTRSLARQRRQRTFFPRYSSGTRAS
jgi:hypothetical protein